MSGRTSWRFLLVVLVVLGVGCGALRSGTSRDETAVFTHAAVAADHPLASAAGAQIMRDGGNAVDAAVAASFCLSVVRPYSCGIGGGGFMLIALPPEAGGEVVALDYRETAPAAVGSDYFQTLGPAETAAGVHAAGVPGTVAGLLVALDRYGSLDRRAVLAPAIALAQGGFPADQNFVAAAAALADRLTATPDCAGDAAYLWNQLALDGGIAVGDWVTNPDQARALELIATGGAEAFYQGPIADAIVDVMRVRGGPITHADLRTYRPRWLDPVRGRFGSYDVYAMPPPSSGGIAMLQILGILERRGIEPGIARDANPGDSAHTLVEAMKHAFADRSRWLADPAYAPVPIDDLLASGYLDERASAIDLATTQPPEAYGLVAAELRDSGTSHLSIIDAQGLAVACTETINLRYGSLVVVPGFGFALNDEMDDFTTTPALVNAFGLRQSDRNLPAPGKRPLSSMSPTVVRHDGRTILVAGASGGPRIITGTLQSILNCLVDGDPAQTAVNRPRLHHQWLPDRVDFEENWTNGAVKRDLAGRGHVLGERESIGNVQLLRVTAGGIEAASDPRKGGRPAGY